MRLADFVLANIEPILAEWETFARTIWPDAVAEKLLLRDHASDILHALAEDMHCAQTGIEQSDKSKGEGLAGEGTGSVDGASDVHALQRVDSGFNLLGVVAEYRALRASVIRLWRESEPNPDLCDLDDLTRFNESIDQSLTEAVRSYMKRVDHSRQMFLAILGHDLRNPLNSMMMSAQALTMGGQLDAESAGMASGIEASARAMAQMISDLLVFTEAGRGAAMPLEPAPMDLASLCREVADEMRAAHPTRTLHFHGHGDLTGEWDGARLRQVVSNLLGNAIQHGDAASAIELTASGQGPQVLIEVRNDGAPIPPDALPTIFDPLIRDVSPGVQKRRRPGSIGLGLHVAREVVTAHGGAIDVKSSAEAGTTFIVRLPRTRATAGPLCEPVAA